MREGSAKTYTDRELDAHFKNLMEHMTSFEAETGASLMRIEAQTVKTNGRVNKLEKWQSYMAGAIAMLGLILSIAVAVGAAVIGKL